jgi:hypothetical protein
MSTTKRCRSAGVSTLGLQITTNTKIRVLTRVAFGFHSAEALIALAMLSLGGYRPDLPGRTRPTVPSGESVLVKPELGVIPTPVPPATLSPTSRYARPNAPAHLCSHREDREPHHPAWMSCDPSSPGATARLP